MRSVDITRPTFVPNMWQRIYSMDDVHVTVSNVWLIPFNLSQVATVMRVSR